MVKWFKIINKSSADIPCITLGKYLKVFNPCLSPSAGPCQGSWYYRDQWLSLVSSLVTCPPAHTPPVAAASCHVLSHVPLYRCHLHSMPSCMVKYDVIMGVAQINKSIQCNQLDLMKDTKLYIIIVPSWSWVGHFTLIDEYHYKNYEFKLMHTKWKREIYLLCQT